MTKSPWTIAADLAIDEVHCLLDNRRVALVWGMCHACRSHDSPFVAGTAQDRANRQLFFAARAAVISSAR